MSFENKILIIEEIISLGMSLYEAFLIAECTEEEILILQNSNEYKKKFELIKLIEERELLKKHKEATEIALKKGNTKPIEWKLSKLKPEVYGTKVVNINKNFNTDEETLDEEERKRVEEEFKYLFKERF